MIAPRAFVAGMKLAFSSDLPTCFMKALAISIVVAALCGMAVPTSAMPNMPHLFASEVARCGGDVAHPSKSQIR